MQYQNNFNELNVAYRNTAQDLPYVTHIIFAPIAWFQTSGIQENKTKTENEKLQFQSVL